MASGLGTMFLGISGATEKLLSIKSGELTSVSNMMMILSLWPLLLFQVFSKLNIYCIS